MSVSRRIRQKLPHFIPFAVFCLFLPYAQSLVDLPLSFAPVCAVFLLLCAILSCYRLKLGGYLLLGAGVLCLAVPLLCGAGAFAIVGVFLFGWHGFFAAWSLRIVERERTAVSS